MRFYFFVLSTLLLFGCGKSTEDVVFINYESGPVSSISKYEITGNKDLIDHSGGYSPAIGSSLFFIEKKKDDLFFYGLTDRGPNAPIQQNNLTKVIFFHPQFEPVVVKIKVNKQKAEIVDFFKVIKNNDIHMTGMPTKGIEGPSFYEVPVNHNIDDIHIYEGGMDSESLTMDKEGHFWIGEEYDPAIIKVNGKTREIEKILRPGQGLPEFVTHRQINRGFEAMAVAPNGKVYAFLEGVLKFDQDDSKINNKIIRLLEIDPNTNNTRTFAYKFDEEAYQHFRKVKIGDLTAINDNEFLLVEQGKAKNGNMTNIIYKIDISNATDIQHFENGIFIEHMLPEDLSKVSVITKKEVLNTNNYGWDEEKLEGLTIVDSKTIALSNDNDFGIDGINSKENHAELSANSYDIRKPHSKQHTKLWLVNFREPIF